SSPARSRVLRCGSSRPRPRLSCRDSRSCCRRDRVSTNSGRQVVAISPDGTELVYVANSRLYARAMWDFEARPIPGSEAYLGVLHPAFSPDGRFVAFWTLADRTIKRLAMTGGTAVTICPANIPYGIAWGDDAIVFGQ